MITEAKAKKLMMKLIILRDKVANGDKKAIEKFKTHEDLCIQQFKYVINMHADRYKTFCNYEDLIQEGYLALLSAMRSYNPDKGSFFYWAHKYIGTKIARSANCHTAIRFPLKFAKANPPHKENKIPTLIETSMGPETNLEHTEAIQKIRDGLSKLNEYQRKIVGLFFGIDDGSSKSVNKVCKTLNISRNECIEILNEALIVLKNNVEL